MASKKTLMAGLIIIAIVALAIIITRPPYLSFQPGGEMPLTGEITLGIENKQLTEGTPVKALQGENLTARFDGEWWNRSYSTYGNAKVSGYWFIDGQFAGSMPGTVNTINQEYPTGTHPDVGTIGKELWQWKTLPAIATLPSQGGTTSITQSTVLPTTGLSKGTHQVQVKVYLLNGPCQSTDIFSCNANPIGSCCPLQTATQGFPCAGIFGETTIFERQKTPACELSNWDGRYKCTSQEDIPCRNNCCMKDWCGAGWCSSVAPGTTSIYPGNGLLYVACGNGPTFSWGDWQETPGEKVLEQAVQEKAKANSVLISIAEFSVVEPCPSQCCVGQEGYEDKFCSGIGVCSGGECITPIQPCPFECCLGDAQYFEKTCPNKTIENGEVQKSCQANACEYTTSCDSGFVLQAGACVEQTQPFQLGLTSLILLGLAALATPVIIALYFKWRK